jgi:hypothetical protein
MMSNAFGFTCVAVVSVASLAVSADGQRAAAVKPTAGTAVLTGTVVSDEASPRPIRRAILTLVPAGSGPALQRLTSTDDQGRFAFTALPAGSYSALRAVRPGFVAAVYGQKRVNGLGSPITLAEGQRLAVTMTMMRAAVITGMVFDRGRPAMSVSVRASPVRIADGVQVPAGVPSRTATTDDRGVYRIFDLAPGDYVVYASPRLSTSGEVHPITEAEIEWANRQLRGGGAPMSAAQPAPAPAAPVTYTSVYFPGTTDPARAGLVTVGAGDERGGLNLNLEYVSTARLSGMILHPDGQPVQTAQLNLLPRSDATVPQDALMLLEMMMPSRSTVSNGRFSMTAVKPGDYTLIARAAERPSGPQQRTGRAGGPGSMTLWASLDVTVSGVDQSNLELRVQPGMTLSGRVVFDGTRPPPADLSRVTVRLMAAPTPGPTIAINVPSGTVSADGTFTLAGVVPGRYLLSASAPAAAPGAPWLVRSALAGRANAADVAFDVQPGHDIADIVVTFTDAVSELSGRLLDAAGRPASDLSIMLIPTDRAMWSPRSRRLRPPVRAGHDGTFRFTNLVPGEYFLAALTDFEPSDLLDPDFLEQVAAAAMKISIAEGEKKVQDLKIAGDSVSARTSTRTP